MARQENLFNCPMCGRPAEVPSRYAGKLFVQSICGSTLRMLVSPSGEVNLELVSKPEVEENFAVDLEAISKSEKGGLYEPRHLRKNLHGSADQQSPVPASFVSTKSPGEDSARLTKALVSPPEQSASRLRETRLTRDRSKSSRLQERFSISRKALIEKLRIFNRGTDTKHLYDPKEVIPILENFNVTSRRGAHRKK